MNLLLEFPEMITCNFMIAVLKRISDKLKDDRTFNNCISLN
jgi:hypothetical protein